MSTLTVQAKRTSSWRQRLGSSNRFGLLLVAFLGATLLVRVLTDDVSPSDSRHSGSFNVSGALAALLVMAAIGLLYRRRRGVWPAALTVLWLCVWTAIAIGTRGASAETVREGVREASIVALAVIVYNSRGFVSPSVAARLVQLLGIVPAVLALDQWATHTGMDVAGALRSNGTFAHPNSAVMFFGMAAAISLWLYLDNGRRRLDALLVVLFAAAVISTFSIDGLITLLAMLIAYGALHAGPLRVRLVPIAVAALVLLAFFATPFGSQRLAKESSTNLATAETEKPNSDFAWRLHKWETLMPDWERHPLLGQGLGTTLTEPAITKNAFAGLPPHNEYVRYLVETGVIGLMILVWALALLSRRLVRMRRAFRTINIDAFNAATLTIVVVIGCLVNALADNTLLDTPAAYAATLIVAATLSLPAAQMRKSPTSPYV
jgi:O-antigen ligase